MARHPQRSWSVILQQAWNLRLKDRHDETEGHQLQEMGEAVRLGQRSDVTYASDIMLENVPMGHVVSLSIAVEYVANGDMVLITAADLSVIIRTIGQTKIIIIGETRKMVTAKRIIIMEMDRLPQRLNSYGFFINIAIILPRIFLIVNLFISFRQWFACPNQ